jgi:hypothetical protein
VKAQFQTQVHWQYLLVMPQMKKLVLSRFGQGLSLLTVVAVKVVMFALQVGHLLVLEEICVFRLVRVWLQVVRVVPQCCAAELVVLAAVVLYWAHQ